MTSFFEKLKKGMELEKAEEAPEKKRVVAEELKVERVEKVEKVKKETPKKIEIKKEEKWPQVEGELAIDLYQTGDDLIIQSAVAGVKPENLNIEIEGDMILIRGVRERPVEEEGEYFSQECYWGPFSRKVLLPVEVNIDKADAEMKEGILTIRIPKIKKEKRKKITVRG
jgi:HSP20 family protein